MEVEPWDHHFLDITDGTGSFWPATHQFWKNYIYYVQELYPNVVWTDTHAAQLNPLINKELCKFNAIRLDPNTSFSRLIFKTEKDKTYFLLRFS